MTVETVLGNNVLLLSWGQVTLDTQLPLKNKISQFILLWLVCLLRCHRIGLIIQRPEWQQMNRPILPAYNCCSWVFSMLFKCFQGCNYYPKSSLLPTETVHNEHNLTWGVHQLCRCLDCSVMRRLCLHGFTFSTLMSSQEIHLDFRLYLQ